MKKISIVLLFVVGFPSFAFGQAIVSDSVQTIVSGQAKDSTLILVEQYALKVQKDWKIPGLSLSIVKDDSLVFTKGFGVREKGRTVQKDGESVAITENTVFHIGSVSKSFTAAVMASVVDDGLVSWDDKVKDVMPDFDWGDDDVENEIQVKDLFIHRTGLVAQVGTYIPNLGYDREDIYQMFKYMKPMYDFRERFAYNNITFLVAARIIEKVSGKSWEDNVRERIFIPLGMNESSLNGEGYLAAGKNASVAHDFRYSPTSDGHGRMAVSPLYGENRALHWVSVIGPAGGVNSTAVDMSKWVKFHLDMGKVASRVVESHEKVSDLLKMDHNSLDSGAVESVDKVSLQLSALANDFPDCDSIQVISRENMEFLHTGVTFVKQDTTSVRHYGYCWYVENNDRYDLIYHTGTTWGFTAICGFVPELRLGFALLCNSEVSEYARFSIMRRIIDLYLLERDREAYLAEFKKNATGENDAEGIVAGVAKEGMGRAASGVANNGTQSAADSVAENVDSGYNTLVLKAIAKMFPEDSARIYEFLCSVDTTEVRRISEGGNDLIFPPHLRYSSLKDWNAYFLAKWWADKKKPSRRAVPCIIKRSKIKPVFADLVGLYTKEQPFGDAKVTLEKGRLYMTIGPLGWKHELKHRTGNEFWMTSGGHTYPVFFHNYPGSDTPGPIDFEIDFNYNENFGPWVGVSN